MTSEDATRLIEEHTIGVEGGPDILSDYDLKTHLNSRSVPLEMTGYVMKFQVRWRTKNFTYIHQVTLDSWKAADDVAKELYRQIGRLCANIEFLKMLTSVNCPV